MHLHPCFLGAWNGDDTSVGEQLTKNKPGYKSPGRLFFFIKETRPVDREWNTTYLIRVISFRGFFDRWQDWNLLGGKKQDYARGISVTRGK